MAEAAGTKRSASSLAAAVPAPVRRRPALAPAAKSPYGALVASAAVIAVVAVGVLRAAGGWQYYTTPLAVRAYAPAHVLLRPSGIVGHSLGLAGFVMMLFPVLYSIRKKWKRLSRLGSMKTWLDVHIFCGIVGPVLVTFHAAFKFNGLISVAYWSMMAVMLSGFVGRYLYVRMPRSIRGVELTYDEILERAGEFHAALEDTGLSAELVGRLESDPGRLERRRIRREMAALGLPAALIAETIRLAAERATLLRRLAYLQRTRRLFSMWHVFHQPLVYVMFGIVLLHVGVAVYLGYAFFLQR